MSGPALVRVILEGGPWDGRVLHVDADRLEVRLPPPSAISIENLLTSNTRKPQFTDPLDFFIYRRCKDELSRFRFVG